MSIEVPANSRGPILDLTLPASEDAIDLILRNKTTGKQLTVNLPEGWDGTDLSLDFYRRTIKDAGGADRSGLLDPDDNELWAVDSFPAGGAGVEVEAKKLETLDTGLVVPSVVSNDASIGSAAWSGTGNVASSDNVYASSAGLSFGDVTNYLKALEFPFELPEEAVPLGVEASLERSRSSELGVRDYSIRLVRNGVIAAKNLSTESPWTKADGTKTFGEPADLWGEDDLTRAECLGSGFGLAVAAIAESSGAKTEPKAQVDLLQMRLYYRAFSPEATPYSAKAVLRWEKGYY